MGADSKSPQQPQGLASSTDGCSQPTTCTVCKQQPHKYRCPGCQAQTCSLACSKQHKQQTGCSGKRDKLAFVPMQQFTDRHLMSDYRWLEEVARADDNARRLRPPTPRRELPQHLSSMVHQAKLRAVRLLIMPPGMQKRKDNSTRYDFRNRKMVWRIEWRFLAATQQAVAAAAVPASEGISCSSTAHPTAAAAPAPAPAVVIDGRVDEETLLCDVLGKHLDYQPGCGGQALLLRSYRAAGIAQLTVVMRKERCPANAVRYYHIDLQQSLKSQLAGKTVIEYPTLLVLLPHEVANYDLITADEQQAEQEAIRQGRFRQQHWPPPPPPPRQVQEQQQQQHEGTAEEEPAAKRQCIGSDDAAEAATQGGLQQHQPDVQQQQGAEVQQAGQEQQQEQQEQQPKYYYYDPTDGVEEDAADLLGGLEEDEGDEQLQQQQQQQGRGAGAPRAQAVVSGVGDDDGAATMMQLLAQYDENEIDIDDS